MIVATYKDNINSLESILNSDIEDIIIRLEEYKEVFNKIDNLTITNNKTEDELTKIITQSI